VPLPNASLREIESECAAFLTLRRPKVGGRSPRS
jgi:hypothetical protein